MYYLQLLNSTQMFYVQGFERLLGGMVYDADRGEFYSRPEDDHEIITISSSEDDDPMPPPRGYLLEQFNRSD